VSHACRLSCSFVSMEAPEEVEVESDGVEEVGGNLVASLMAAGRGFLPSIRASQAFLQRCRWDHVDNCENLNAS